MLIRGEWSLCDDGVERPIIHGEMQGASGRWKSFPFLVDTGADRTVLSASALTLLRSLGHETSEQISGVGGNIEAILITAEILLTLDSGAKPTKWW